MLKKSKKGPKTLSEKVTELIAHPHGSDGSEDSADEATAPKVVDFEEDYDLPDVQATDIRKRNIKLLSDQSARYKGKIATRKELEEDSQGEESDEEDEEDIEQEEEDDSEDDDEKALSAFSMQLKKTANGYDFGGASDSEEGGLEGDDGEEDDEDDDDDEENGDEDEDDDDDESDEEAEEEGADLIAETNHQAEIEKGRCVQNQLRIWERLLELRIHSQKLQTKANQLPDPEDLKQQKQDNPEVRTACQEATQNVSLLLKNLLDLQSALTSQFPEMKTAMKASLKRTSPFDDSKAGPPLKRVAENLEHNFSEFRTYRNAVLLKWDDRTKLLTPGAGAKKRSLNEDFDILRKIDNTLMNRSTLIGKSQVVKGAGQQQTPAETEEQPENPAQDSLGNGPEEKRNPNIYDDTDFYHQQLRELIEYKANTSSSMTEVTKQFVELQKLRQKMKKKVDTRASKGRKMRYTVHNKLVNFMAPHDPSNWTDESKHELYKSLFAT